MRAIARLWRRYQGYRGCHRLRSRYDTQIVNSLEVGKWPRPEYRVGGGGSRLCAI